MRVDDVPAWAKPAFHAFGYGVGGVLQAVSELTRATCRVALRRAPPFAGPRIECMWHENLPAYIATYLPAPDGVRYVWMNHPTWYMRPVHVLLALRGVRELALGSSGHGGQRALARVVEALTEGARTSMAVDGPGGPVHELKRGALDMALASGVPIVAVRFAYSRYVRSPEWDKKIFPAPGSTITIEESGPYYVTRANYEAVRQRVCQGL